MKITLSTEKTSINLLVKTDEDGYIYLTESQVARINKLKKTGEIKENVRIGWFPFSGSGHPYLLKNDEPIKNW